MTLTLAEYVVGSNAEIASASPAQINDDQTRNARASINEEPRSKSDSCSVAVTLSAGASSISDRAHIVEHSLSQSADLMEAKRHHSALQM